MGLFGKKKKEQIDETQFADGKDEELPTKKLFKKKNFKDLNSKDKRARREPKKPWGKVERVVVLLALFVTAGISAYLWVSSAGWKLSETIHFSNFKFTLPNLFMEETIILENEKLNQ